MLKQVEASLTDLRDDEKVVEEVSFVNGKRLRYPRWFLYRDDKDIKQKFLEAFGQHVIKPAHPELLLHSYATLNMVPENLLNLFRSIQTSGNP